jgi:hypothetical protein
MTRETYTDIAPKMPPISSNGDNTTPLPSSSSMVILAIEFNIRHDVVMCIFDVVLSELSNMAMSEVKQQGGTRSVFKGNKEHMIRLTRTTRNFQAFVFNLQLEPVIFLRTQLDCLDVTLRAVSYRSSTATGGFGCDAWSRSPDKDDYRLIHPFAVL